MKITQSLRAQLMITAFILFFVATGPSVEASSVVRTGEAVSIGEEQIIEGDFYSVAGKLNISGEVQEDALLMAGQVTVNGSVGADAFLVGGTVNVYGTIGDDLRVIAGEVTIADPVMGDVMVIGGIVNILPTASIAGDLILLSGQVTVEGSVGGDIMGRAEELRIDAPVAGGVDVTVTNFTLGEKANVEGSVVYVSRNLVVQALNATVGGELVRNDPVLPVANEVNVRTMFLPLLVLMFSALAWYLVSRKSLSVVVNRALQKSPRPLLFGFATLILTPFAIVVLSVSMIGSLVGIALFFGYGLFIVLAMIGSTAVLGQLMMKLFNQQTAKLSLISLIVGVVGVSLLMLLPFIGPIVLLMLFIITLGAIVDSVVRSH